MLIKDVYRLVPLVSGLLLLAGCGGGGSGASSEPPSSSPQSPLAGQISIEASSRIDQDTMDELAFSGAQPADSPQTLPVNFILAGYLSGLSGSYSTINGQVFGFQADPEDIYSVPMAPGEVVRLISLGSRAGDPTLTLTLEDGPSETTSRSSEPAEVALASGMPEQNYSIKVATTGNVPARYVLVKAASAQLGSFSLEWPDHDFMAEEAIVTLRQSASGGAGSLTAQTAVAARQLGGSDWLMRMPAQAVAAGARAGSVEAQTLNWIEDLRKRPEVSSAVPNYRFSSFATPVDEELYRLQWHYDLINGPVAWQLAPGGGTGVRVAVLDSGLFSPDGNPSNQTWHPDLQQNVVQGRDFVDGDNYPRDPGNSVGSNVFHGTHVAGTIGAVVQGSSGNTGEGIGGVAFGSSIVPVRVLGEGGTGSSDDLIAAVRWVTGQDGGGRKAEVVNLSLGGLPRIPQLEDAIAYGVQQEDMIFVGAAGNSATSQESYPAASDNVLAVSSVDAGGSLASYSNFGSWIDLAAPGGDASRDGNNDGRADVVWSTSAVDGESGFEASYTGLQGTSMAAPHVSGVMALLKEQNSQRDYEAIRGLLQAGELTQGSGTRSDQLGFGILDASKALQADSSVTVLSPSPSQVVLGSETSATQTVSLNRIGDGAVSIDSMSQPPPWFMVSLRDLSDDNFALDLTLDESALEENVSYRDTLKVTYTGEGVQRTLGIPVIAQVLSDEFARTAGTHFVLLVNTTPNNEGFFEAESQIAVDVE
ncbi:MAG: S8 family serine peptidase, partial [Marinobacter sp.]|nr:S8 family serine peptidase [Marinobacter sp.]